MESPTKTHICRRDLCICLSIASSSLIPDTSMSRMKAPTRLRMKVQVCYENSIKPVKTDGCMGKVTSAAKAMQAGIIGTLISP